MSFRYDLWRLASPPDDGSDETYCEVCANLRPRASLNAAGLCPSCEEENDAKMADAIIETRSPYIIREYATHGERSDLYGTHRISEGARQILVGYLRQAEAFARGNPPAEQTDHYGRVKTTGAW